MKIWKTLTDTIHRSVSQLWNDDELQQLIKAANRQYGHLIGRPVIWIAPSGKKCHGIATEVNVYGDGETWLKVEYFINRYDNGELLAMTEVMRVGSYLLPVVERGLDWSMKNIDELQWAAQEEQTMTTQQSAALKAARKEWHEACLNVREAQRRNSFNNILYWSEVKRQRCQTVIELRRAWQADSTAAALAEAQAEVARLRTAVARAANDIDYVTENNAGQTWSDYESAMKRVARNLRRALETAPAGEASDGNG